MVRYFYKFMLVWQQPRRQQWIGNTVQYKKIGHIQYYMHLLLYVHKHSSDAEWPLLAETESFPDSKNIKCLNIWRTDTKVPTAARALELSSGLAFETKFEMARNYASYITNKAKVKSQEIDQAGQVQLRTGPMGLTHPPPFLRDWVTEGLSQSHTSHRQVKGRSLGQTVNFWSWVASPAANLDLHWEKAWSTFKDVCRSSMSKPQHTLDTKVGTWLHG